MESCLKSLSILTRHPLYPTFQDLTSLKDPVRSGLFFVIINITLYILSEGYTVLSLVSTILFYLLLVSIIYSLFMAKIYKVNNGLGEKFSSSDFAVSEDFWNEHCAVIHEFLDSDRKCLYDIFTVKNKFETLKAIVQFFVLSFIFGNVCIFTLITIGIWVGFLFPVAYSQKPKEIDALLEKACEVYNKALQELNTKVPQIQTVIAKLKQD